MIRSIMAESITRKYMHMDIKAASGGSDPGDDIHPVAFRVLKDMRNSCNNLVSKSWDVHYGWEPNIVITLCNQVLKRKCPSYVGQAVHVHWGIDDPIKKFGNMEENFKAVFKILDERIAKVVDADIKSMDNETLRAHLKKAVL